MSTLKSGEHSMLLKKWKFFSYRFFAYLSFFLVPYWTQFVLKLDFIYQLIFMMVYIFFLTTQWFLLAKEVDYRLKIYVKAHSSMDRIIQRLFLGYALFIFFFNIISFLPSSWSHYLFWGTWGVLGLFYSWPTRGKIVTETMSQDFGEFKFLDGFEKTVLTLTILTFFVSFPRLQDFTQIDSFKLLLDNNGLFHEMYWNFMQIQFLPFAEHAQLFNLAWISHLYFCGLGLFLITSYCIFRYFFSRRLALLGVYAIVSTWSFSKIVNLELIPSLSTTAGIIWIWASIWSLHAGTYRAGFLKGLIIFFASLWNRSFLYLYLVDIVLILSFFRHYTFWYRRQMIKYTLFGLGLLLIVVLVDEQSSAGVALFSWDLKLIKKYFVQKSFYLLSVLGVVIYLLKMSLFRKKKDILPFLDKKDGDLVMASTFCLLALSTIFNNIGSHFYFIWLFSFLSLFPLQYLFYLIAPFRSKRNLIFLVYILVCLLDSHFEGRVKIFIENW
jgi:hypothetical protein